MKIKLNFLLGQPTLNGRNYDQAMLKEQFDELIQENGHIAVGPDSSCIDEKEGTIPSEMTVGFVKNYEISNSGEVIFDVEELSQETEDYLTKNPDLIKLSIFGFGNMDEHKNVRGFKLTSLFMTVEQ